ncbi:MAG: transcriptional regulator with XRE-family HTH domain [Candidatus Omnitrophota bacterium]|jgi:transcriptional regulator with XRE-family HTH domain
MPTINQAEGELFRKARDVLGYTQKQLALEAGVDQSTISRLERGDFNGVSAGRLNEIRLALQLPLPSLGPDPRSLTLACCKNPHCISHIAIESDATYLLPHFVKVQTDRTAFCRYCPGALEQTCSCGEAFVDAIRCPHCREFYVNVLDAFNAPGWAQDHNEAARLMLELKQRLQSADTEDVYEVMRNDDGPDRSPEQPVNDQNEGLGGEKSKRLTGRPE